MRPRRIEFALRGSAPPAWCAAYRERMEAALVAALEHSSWGGEALSVALVDDEEIGRIHGEFLDDPEATDVITFDLRDEEIEPGVPAPGGVPTDAPGGELVVSYATAERIATERGHEAWLECLLYVVHGALHLVGHDDHDEVDRAAMRRAERACFDRLGLRYPY